MAVVTPTIGILIFDGVEELDFVGPWEVFCAAAYERAGTRVVLIAEHDRPVTCANGMRVLPDMTIGDAPRLDLVLVPGGEGTRREATNRVLLEWLSGVAKDCQWVTSVCTGSLLLAAAGLCDSRRITTHWEFVPALRALGRGTVLDGPRYVRDGNLVTAAGVSAGIDMALWLVGQIWDPNFARRVQKMIQYDPAPPYQAAT
jgi:transcriptional regulator GlxA family with amidase domain